MLLHKKIKLKIIALNFVIAVIYIVLAKIGLLFALKDSTITIFWPAGGFALAILLLIGPKYIPGIFVGAIVAGFIIHLTPWVAALLALANITESYIAYWLSTRHFHVNLALETRLDFWKLTLLASVSASAIGAMFGSTTLLLTDVIPVNLYPQIFLRWWMGDTLGIAFLTPLILIWSRPPQKFINRQQMIELMALLGLSAILCCIFFFELLLCSKYEPQGIAWIIMMIAWSAFRFGRHITTVLQLIIFTLALWSSSHNIGHYANDMVQSGLLNFWLFGMFSAIGGLTIAVMRDESRIAEDALREQEEFFRLIAENGDDFIAVLDLDGRRKYNNRAYAELFGDIEALKGTNSFTEIHPDDRNRIMDLFKDTVDSGKGHRTEFRFVLANGEIRHIESCGALIKNNRGEPKSVVTVSRDITEHKNFEKKIQQSEERLRLALKAGNQGWFDINVQTGEISVSPEYARMIGYDADTFNTNLDDCKNSIHPDDYEAVKEAFQMCLEKCKPTTIEYRRLSAKGYWVWICSVGTVSEWDADNHPLRVVGTHTNISKRKRLEMELKRQAHIDSLTGLYNRGHFMELAEHELSRSIRYEIPLAILMVDIDFFKHVNDSYGHKAGDMVLKKLAEVCRRTLREIDILGRIGGEEFVIFLPETNKDKALEVAERLRTNIASTKVFIVSGNPHLRFTISIGVTVLSSKEDVLDILLSRADAALYEAKNSGRNRVCFRQ